MEWTRGVIIGRGSTATVSLATTTVSGELFAVKSTEFPHLQTEQTFLSKLNSPYIVKYLGFDITHENGKPLYNLHMEYVPGGTLHDAIHGRGGRLSEVMIGSYTKQILLGLSYLHKNGIAHCDIKSHNILLGEEAVKISDLGCAKLVGTTMSAFAGTPAFMSPEVARSEEQGFEADIWSVGCTIIEMATGSTPWPELNDPVSALYRIGFSSEGPKIPAWLSVKAKDFLNKCLMQCPRERWNVEQLLDHPFLVDVEVELGCSPCSVLNQTIWDDSMESCSSSSHKGLSLNSPVERIECLIGEGNFDETSWSWGEDWITVRVSDQSEDILVHDEPSNFDSIVYYEEEIDNSMFVDDFLLFLEESIALTNLNFEVDDSCILISSGNLNLDSKLIPSFLHALLIPFYF
ncbi:hypothetical protein ACFE04_007095 [Oxalis oulophora]